MVGDPISDDEAKLTFRDAVLEIKCPCPFYSKDNVLYKYLKKQPWKDVPYYYVPQIYMQMYQMEKDHAVIVNYTPTCGTKIYTTDFNEHYSDFLLKMIRKFVRFCLESEVPPNDSFWVDSYPSEYSKFLRDTLAVVESCKEIKFIRPEECNKILTPYFGSLNMWE